MFFSTETDPEKVKDTSFDKYILASGIYPLTIKHVTVEESKEEGSKSQWLNLYAEYEGVEQIFFNSIILKKKDGSDCGQKDLFNKLCIIAEVDSIDDPIEEETVNKRTGETITIKVLPEFDDLEVYARIQIEYSIYNGKIQMKKRIRSFFRASDKASASEIVNKVPKAPSEDEKAPYIGKQFKIEEEKAGAVTYKDGLTEETVKEWIAANKKNKPTSETASTAVTPAGATAPKDNFRKSRFGRSA
jgi:hypothetical protein